MKKKLKMNSFLVFCLFQDDLKTLIHCSHFKVHIWTNNYKWILYIGMPVILLCKLAM